MDITLVRCRSEWRGTGKRRSSVCSCSAGLGGRRLDSYLCQFDNIYMIYISYIYIYHIYIIYIYHIYISYIYISYIYGTISGHHGHCFENMMDHDFFPWRCRIPPKAMLLVPGRGFSGHESRNVGCNKPSKDVMWDLYQQRCVIWFAYT